MKKFFLFLLLTLISLQTFAALNNNDAINQIQKSFAEQTATWNKGDVHAFMKSYDNSSSTLYVSSDIIHGYDAILERYLTHYKNQDEMGKLSASIVDVKILSPDYAMVIGKWHLTRTKEKDVGGVFTLLYKKTNMGWKIIVDHTS